MNYDTFQSSDNSETVPLSMAKRVCPMAKFVWSMAMLLPPIHFHQKQTLYIRPERLILLIGEIQSLILVINWDSVSMMCQKCVSKWESVSL